RRALGRLSGRVGPRPRGAGRRRHLPHPGGGHQQAAPDRWRAGMKTIETDILIVGSGITAALMAAHLAETTKRAITVVEAGRATTPRDERAKARERYLAYGE